MYTPYYWLDNWWSLIDRALPLSLSLFARIPSLNQAHVKHLLDRHDHILRSDGYTLDMHLMAGILDELIESLEILPYNIYMGVAWVLWNVLCVQTTMRKDIQRQM